MTAASAVCSRHTAYLIKAKWQAADASKPTLRGNMYKLQLTAQLPKVTPNEAAFPNGHRHTYSRAKLT